MSFYAGLCELHSPGSLHADAPGMGVKMSKYLTLLLRCPPAALHGSELSASPPEVVAINSLKTSLWLTACTLIA